MEKTMFDYVFNRYLDKNYSKFEEKKIDEEVLRKFVRNLYEQQSISSNEEVFKNSPKEAKKVFIDIAVKSLPEFEFKDYIVYLQNNKVQAVNIPRMNETIQVFKESAKFREEFARNPTLMNQYDKILYEMIKSPFVFERCAMYIHADVDADEKEYGDRPFEERYRTAEEAKAAEPEVYREMIEIYISSNILSRFKIGQGDHRKDDTMYSIKVVNERSNDGRMIDTIKLQEASNIDETIIEEEISMATPIIKKLVDYSSKHFNGISIISIYKAIMNYRMETSHHLKPGDMKFDKFMNYLCASDNILFYDIAGKRFFPKVIDNPKEEEVYDAIEDVFDAMQFNANIRQFDELTMLLKLFQIAQLRYHFLSEKFKDEIILNFSSRFYRGKLNTNSDYYKFIDAACTTINNYSTSITTIQQLIAVITMSNYKAWNVSSVNRFNLALNYINLLKVDYNAAICSIMGAVKGFDPAVAINHMQTVKRYTTLNRYAIEDVIEIIPQEHDMHYNELSILINKYYIFKNSSTDTFNFDKFKKDMEFLGINTPFDAVDLDSNGFILQFGDMPIVLPRNLMVKRKDVEDNIQQKKIIAEIFETDKYNAVLATTKNEYILFNTKSRINDKFIIFKIANGRIVCQVERLTYLY